MERDPVRFVWRAAPGLNIALILLAVAAVPAVWAVLELVRTAIDDAAFGRAFRSDAGTAPFFRFAIALPERIAERALVLLPGFELGRDGYVRAVVAALLATGLGAGLFVLVFNLIRTSVGREAADALGRRILIGISSAPVSATAAAQRAAGSAGEALTGQRRVLGSAIGSPALSGAMLLASLTYVAAVDLRLLALCGCGLAAFGVAGKLFVHFRVRMARAEQAANEQLRRAVTDLAQFLSALAAHGTATREQERITAELGPTRDAAMRIERQAVAVSGLVLAIALCVPLTVLGVGAALGLPDAVTPGEAVASAIAATIGIGALATFVRWQRAIERVRPVFAEIARQLGAFHSRRRDGKAPPLLARGTLAVEGVVTDGTLQGGRLAGLDLRLDLPAHVALLGDAGSGVRSFAGLLGGQVLPRAGRVALEGIDLVEADAASRATRLAFAGGDTFLLPATLRANLLYGCPDPDAGDIDARLERAIEVADLSALVYRRGLAGTVDPRREPELAARVVSLRPAIGAALERAGLLSLVQPFDAARYNPQATLGENIMFGVPLGDTFRDENLPAHPFMRTLLDREGLTEPLVALGTAIVRSTLEMFWGLSSRNIIVGRFSLLSGPERDEFEVLLSRQGQVRGAAAARDQGRLIGLALRYGEVRHRLGLVTPDLEARILRVRSAFAADLPKSLESAIEFFRPDRLCASTSMLDNLLFGRIALDRADARDAVLAVVNRVLAEAGLAPEVVRTGLLTWVDPTTSGLTSSQSAAVDLVRCLVRQPDNLVVQRALDELPGHAAIALVARLQAAMAGKGLLLVLPMQAESAIATFDRILAFDFGRVVSDTSPRSGTDAASAASALAR